MRSTSLSTKLSLLSVLGALAASACTAELPPEAVEELDEQVAPAVQEPSTAAADARAERLVRETASRSLISQLAAALRDPSERKALHAALSASEVKEGKLHLGSYLKGQGASMLASAQAHANAQGLDVKALLAQAGNLEMYLPVDEHRTAWQGSDDLLIATQLDDLDGKIFGVDLDGKPVTLSNAAPPARPTLVLVPSESFNAQGAALARDLSGGPAASVLSYTGLWVNELHVANTQEGWTYGDPEIEVHVQNATTRATISCSGEYVVEPFRFNMNHNDYTAPFLLIDEASLGAGVPFVIAAYEDDDTACVIKTGTDQIKAISDAITAAVGLGKSVMARDLVSGLYAFRSLYLALKQVFGSDDDLIGVSAGFTSIGSAPTLVYLRNAAMAPMGTMVLQRKTDIAH